MTQDPSNPGTPPPVPQGSGEAQATGAPVSTSSKPATTVTAGTLIMGTYEIEKLINSGGMGEVYRGRNIHNGEPVAIKIVLPSLAHDPKIVALFQKESTTLSRLSHEAIVRYHVFTVDPTIGRPCMVMEFVSGTAMSDRIEQGPMPADDVRVMLRRVASGLDKAHRAGVVHRDLSPDNVILEEGMVEHAKLIDFGIAKSTAMGAGTLLQGQFAGKFNWVAPEQLGAFGGHVDGRSDIYSLALVTAAASKGEVLQMGASIVDAVGKRSSVPDLTGVDPSLIPLLSWMLQPDPALRPESMAKVMAAVDNTDLIPQAAPKVVAVDPNRTVIGGALPPFDLSAAAAVAAKSEPPAAVKSLPPMAAPPITTPPAAAGWDLSGTGPQSVPPLGATVIASVPPLGRAAVPDEEPEDFSPFGAPGAETKPAAVAAPVAVPVAKKGKGGVMAVLVLLAAGAGGAYYAGVLDPKPTGVADAPPAVAEPKQTDPAVAEAEAAAKQATELAAATKAAEDAAAKKAADDAAAAQLAEAEAAAKKAADDAAAAKLSEAEAAAKKAADDAAAAQLSQAEAAAKAAADAKAAEAAAKAAETAKAEAAKAAETAAAQKAAEVAAAAKAAEEAAAAKAAADAKAAEEAAQLAAEAAAKSDDPVARQTAFLAGFTPAACSHVSLADPRPEGFVLHGFAADTKPLEDMAKAWKDQTGLDPDVQVHLINEQQCALLDFINRHPTAVDVTPIAIKMDPALGEVVKSGGVVKGTITGVGAGALTLLNVSGAGGISILNPFIETTDDGTISFGITLKLVAGAPPEPQLFFVMETEPKLQALLAAVKPRTSVKALMPFIDLALTKDPAPIKLGLAYIRLEN